MVLFQLSHMSNLERTLRLINYFPWLSQKPGIQQRDNRFPNTVKSEIKPCKCWICLRRTCFCQTHLFLHTHLDICVRRIGSFLIGWFHSKNSSKKCHHRRQNNIYNNNQECHCQMYKLFSKEGWFTQSRPEI